MTRNYDRDSRDAAIDALIKSAGIDPHSAEARALSDKITAAMRDAKKESANRTRLRKIDESKQHIPAREGLTEDQVARLPRWVREQIDESRLVGQSGNVIQTPDGRKYHRKNPLNDLSGGEWTYFLSSVTNTRYPTSGDESFAHHLRKVHPSPKPPQLMRSIIEFFTKEGETVLDYFMGVGGTLLGASLCGRNAIGIDLDQRYIEVYEAAANHLALPVQQTVCADSLEWLKSPATDSGSLQEESLSLILIDPPYGDMMSREKTGEAIKKKKDSAPTPFTADARDLGNLSIPDFHVAFRQSVKDSMRWLKPNGHIVVFIKDLQPTRTNVNLLHAQIINDLHDIPRLHYLGMKIWADQGVNLYPYGYPFSFVSNQIHQYILIFKKRDA